MGQPPDPLTWLRAHGAQSDVVDGLARFARDWPTMWADCPRGDWLLGIAARAGVEHTVLVRAAVACARTAAELTAAEPALAERCERLLSAADAWSRGEGSREEASDATRHLEEALAGARDPATEAAARATLAVGLGIKDRDVLASAPACAAEAHMMGAIDCGLEMAMRWAHDRCAAAVRAAIAWPLVEACLARAT